MEKLKPTKNEVEKEKAIVEKIIGLIKEVSGRDAMLVGSIAKNTALRGDKDIDIFILFPKSIPRKQLEEEGLSIGRKVCKLLGVKPRLKYAEHPYTCTTVDGYDVDIVPCYKIKMGEKIISAVDRSPLHTEYIKKHLKNTDDARMLKYFMKKIGVYGAEIETHGFSGYLCELLVLHYGSFENVLKAASRWERGKRIDIEGKSNERFNAPLVVIDPVDPHRNVAAAVSEQKLCEFILLARYYLKHKTIPKKAKIMKKRGKIYVVEWALKKEEVKEILWSQLERFQDKVVRHLNFHELHCIDSMIWTDAKTKAQLLVELEVWDMPPINDHWGPRVYDIEHSKLFIEKYGKVMVRKNRLVTEKRREYPTAKGLLKDLLKEVPSHLKRKKWTIKKGNAARATEIWQIYSKKFWNLK
ncbi:MAG: CCA tRNA nucleotidyltransferase [Candidatus Diapherotrites archaeon]|nr:CCA tRNA nucleotidyltransferase [Candidatus Diapherotrites archaeon]